VDERAVALAESTLRRSLASLDGLPVPTLAALRGRHRSLPRWRALIAPLATAAVVLVAALAVGQGLALWRADRSSSVAATASPSPTLPDQRYLDTDGYRFTITLINDPVYGPSTTAPYAVSAMLGLGVRCEWTRTGPDVAKATDLWGTTDTAAPTGGSGAMPRGAQGNRTNGVPAAAVNGSRATMVCGIDDETGRHGVVIDLSLGADGQTVRSLALSRWSGILGDTSAIAPCTGKAGSAQLIAAFVSTAADVASWVENAAYPDAPQLRNSAFRTAYAPTAPIYVCYFSGSWAPSTPLPPPGHTYEPVEYNRARYFVDASGNVVMPTTIGSTTPSAFLPIVRPGGRF